MICIFFVSHNLIILVLISKRFSFYQNNNIFLKILKKNLINLIIYEKKSKDENKFYREKYKDIFQIHITSL